MKHWRLRLCQSSVHLWHPLHWRLQPLLEGEKKDKRRSFTSIQMLHTHCGAMVSGICEWCHRRRLMSWVAFHRKHTETPWGRRIPKDEFWEIENPTCRNIPKQPEEKSLFNRSSRYVKTASRFHITGKSEGLPWCQLHSNVWHPLLHRNMIDSSKLNRTHTHTMAPKWGKPQRTYYYLANLKISWWALLSR